MNLIPKNKRKFSDHLHSERYLSEKTIENHAYRLERFSRFLEKRKISFNYDSFQLYLSDLLKTHKKSSVANYICTLRIYCDFLVQEKIIDENFARRVKLPKFKNDIPDILSINEVEALIEVAPAPFWKTLIQLLAESGMRIGEVLNLKIEDLNLKDNSIKVKQTKTFNQRIVPISPIMNKKLTGLIASRDPPEFVFPSPRTGERLANNTVWIRVKNFAKEAKINKNVHPHTFRHSFVTELLRQDLSILKVAAIVGHEKVATTQRYSHLLYEDLRQAILRHPLIRKHRNPYEILDHIKVTIKKFNLSEDKRFFYEIVEGNEGIRVNIFIR